MDNGQTGVREKISSQFLMMANNIAEKAEDVEKSAESRLSAVQVPMPPTTPQGLKGHGPDVEMWPPLFNEARTILIRIESALRNIKENISRAEI